MWSIIDRAAAMIEKSFISLARLQMPCLAMRLISSLVGDI
jgi:hypothetical protein